MDHSVLLLFVLVDVQNVFSQTNWLWIGVFEGEFVENVNLSELVLI